VKKQIIILLATIILASCKTQLVYITVMDPAPVSIPPYIKKAGVVNRSLVSGQNKKVDAIDKVLSLEGANLDKEGAESGLKGLTDELMKNNRFNEVKLLDDIELRTPGSGVFPAPLAWDIVEKICMENKIDALFSLEMFDTDTKISYAANPVTIKTPLGNLPGIEHQANMLTEVKTGWRIYDPTGRNILDEVPISESITFSGKGINPVVAATALIGRKEAVKEVSSKVGQSYAFRILPFWTKVQRDYYVKGTSNFETAKRKAQTGNWNEAGELWFRETTNPSYKLAGRACYNMAIINEINGNLDTAIDWARKAYENYNNKLALRYINALKYRKENVSILKSQDLK
jgi:hypothetical protein